MSAPEHTSLPLPVVELPFALHVGTLLPQDKTPYSHEGNGLSVSLHPEAWRQIARLGASATWRIEHPSRALRMLDLHSLSPALRHQVLAWAERAGLITRRTMYSAPLLDENDDIPEHKLIEMAAARRDRVRSRALDLLRSLSPEDREVLQNDLLGRDPDAPRMPSVLREAFKEWLREYHPIEQETMMAPENQAATEAKFYEEHADNSDDPQERAMALAMRSGGPQGLLAEAQQRPCAAAGFAQQTVHSTRQEAEAEALALLEVHETLSEEDAKAQVREIAAWQATPLMIDRLGMQPPAANVPNLAATLWVEDHPQHELDGVWWADELDVHQLSAPRGVLHKRGLPSLSFSPATSHCLAEAMELTEHAQQQPTPNTY